jgi:hypothetical protein
MFAPLQLQPILGLINSIGVALIVLGVVLAFAYRVAYYIELAAGFAFAGLVAFFVWNVSHNIAWTALALLLILGGAFASASAGAVIAISDGFLAAFVGFVALLFPTDISQITAAFVFVCAISAALCTGFGIFLGTLAAGLSHSFNLNAPRVTIRPKSRPAVTSKVAQKSHRGRFCMSCGHRLRQNAKYCLACGRQVSRFDGAISTDFD